MKSKAILTRCVVLDQPQAGGTVFFGTVERDDDVVNLRLPYNWPKIEEDPSEFLQAIKDQVAQDLDCAVSSVELDDDRLLERLEYFWKQLDIRSGGLMGGLQAQ